MIESRVNQCIIDDIESDVFEELLEFIYTGKLTNRKSNVFQLLAAAEKYEVLDLKYICEDMIFNEITIENAIQTLINAHKYSATKVLDKMR